MRIMRKLIIYPLFVAVSILSSVAYCQWTEYSYSSSSGSVVVNLNKEKNTSGSTVYSSGYFRFYYEQEVSEDWWNNGDGYFPTSPLWRSGFQVVSFQQLYEDKYYYNVEVPNNYRLTASMQKLFELGENSWTYDYEGLVGSTSRHRTWETMNTSNSSVSVEPG